ALAPREGGGAAGGGGRAVTGLAGPAGGSGGAPGGQLVRRIGADATLLAIPGVWGPATQTRLGSGPGLPRFTDVATTWWQLLASGELLRETLSSLGRQTAGFATAVVVGVSLGVLMARFRAVDDFAGPLITMVLPIPKAALIPLVMLWFGIGDAAKT